MDATVFIGSRGISDPSMIVLAFAAGGRVVLPSRLQQTRPCSESAHPPQTSPCLERNSLNRGYIRSRDCRSTLSISQTTAIQLVVRNHRRDGLHQTNHHPGLQEVGRFSTSRIAYLTRHATATKTRHRSSRSRPRAMSSWAAMAPARATSSPPCGSCSATTTTT